MQPLGPMPDDLTAVDRPAPARSRTRIVLPRILRRPARMLGRVHWNVPHRAGLKGAALLVGLTVASGTVIGGHVPPLVGTLTARAGLEIAAVRITGQTETSEVDVLASLAIPSYASMVLFDADAARARVQSLPWVEHASIRKIYPGTLDVAIRERTPFAIWQRGGLLSLIDEDGHVISNTVGPSYAGLPLVIGHGADRRAQEIVDLVDPYPALRGKLRGAMLVSDRRWTLNLEGGIAILLPEENPAGALERVVAADAQSQLLARAITAVDVRQPGELVVRLTDAALADLRKLQSDRARANRGRGNNA